MLRVGSLDDTMCNGADLGASGVWGYMAWDSGLWVVERCVV